MCIRFTMFKNFIKFITILFFFTSNSWAESFSKYNITGNERVSKQTIINFSQLKKDTDLSQSDLNKALKNF